MPTTCVKEQDTLNFSSGVEVSASVDFVMSSDEMAYVLALQDETLAYHNAKDGDIL